MTDEKQALTVRPLPSAFTPYINRRINWPCGCQQRPSPTRIPQRDRALDEYEIDRRVGIQVPGKALSHADWLLRRDCQPTTLLKGLHIDAEFIYEATSPCTTHLKGHKGYVEYFPPTDHAWDCPCFERGFPRRARPSSMLINGDKWRGPYGIIYRGLFKRSYWVFQCGHEYPFDPLCQQEDDFDEKWRNTNHIRLTSPGTKPGTHSLGLLTGIHEEAEFVFERLGWEVNYCWMCSLLSGEVAREEERLLRRRAPPTDFLGL